MKSFRFYSAFAILLTLIAFLSACSKTSPPTENPPTKKPPTSLPPVDNDPDIYSAGTVSNYRADIGARFNYAAYWKNKELVQLSKEESSACCIIVGDSGVYVAGNGPQGYYITVPACYWKNGVYHDLFHGYHDEHPTGICSNGKDIYISGFGSKSNRFVAEYWKNGQPVIMPADFDVSQANGIAVSGSDVYLAGFRYNYNSNLHSAAVLWKNGIATPLTDGKHYAKATGIFIQGSDVYVCGQESEDQADDYEIAKYWKNGKEVKLSSDGTSNFITKSIFVDQNDVYVAGFQHPGPYAARDALYIATYWKNGVETKLFPGSTNDSYAYTILAWNSDIYLSYDHYADPTPGYLKNQTVQKVDGGSFQYGTIKDIFIKSKQ